MGVSLLYGPTLDGRACAGLLAGSEERERERVEEREVAEQWAAVARLSRRSVNTAVPLRNGRVRQRGGLPGFRFTETLFL